MPEDALWGSRGLIAVHGSTCHADYFATQGYGEAMDREQALCRASKNPPDTMAFNPAGRDFRAMVCDHSEFA